ncbi:hypothetical protein JR316_0009379 [Psilocybe cubensis]|uniref:Uncharacterized protein n=4 Tax=Psilocybe cubensis TaxID=181762 RepID=A0ACB8GU83_PSICU|nr:hypothetical protein JR316_0009379 [Psilocybe cubensis]KAH9478917.1 hypothetical protein JR316_0009379 [Psilocybe cubensis]
MKFSTVFSTLAMAASALSGVAAQTTSRCWTSATPVAANYGPLADLRTDAGIFCNEYAAGPGISSAGRLIFGFQSAGFFGNFASNSSCLATFNQLVTDCYGTNPSRPATLGGVRTDPGGAELVIAFGDGTKL